MKFTYLHHDPRFVVELAHTYACGRYRVIASVYWRDRDELFYRTTRTSAKSARHAVTRAIRKHAPVAA